MIINHNISALNTHRQLGANTNAVAKNLEKLSSGLKINRAGDDAAGLAISEKMRGQIRGLEMATKNAQDGISLIQTAEGALQETHAILQRMRELAVQSANDMNMDAVDREAMQEELTALMEEINEIADRTEFNTQKLIDGSFTGKKFHIGANEGQSIDVAIDQMNAAGIGLNGGDEVEKEVAEYTTGTVTLESQGSLGSLSNVAAGTYNVVYQNDEDGNQTDVAVEIDGDYYATDNISVDSSAGTLSAVDSSQVYKIDE